MREAVVVTAVTTTAAMAPAAEKFHRGHEVRERIGTNLRGLCSS